VGHALAYGAIEQNQSVPVWSGAIDRLPDPLKPFAHLLEPPFPEPLDWGAVSHLQEHVLAALDSPILHAWLYTDENQTILEIIITGKGLPEVRAEVTAAALSCFFALEPKIDDFCPDRRYPSCRPGNGGRESRAQPVDSKHPPALPDPQPEGAKN